MNAHIKTAACLLAASTFTVGCSSPGYSPTQSQTYPAQQSYSSAYGVVESIQLVQGGNDGIGVGTVAGGVVGGLLGNQVGSGSGRTAATVAGAVGGAVVGNQVEKSRSARQMYQVGVRLDNGTYQTLTQDSATDLGVGTRVRIENNRAYRY